MTERETHSQKILGLLKFTNYSVQVLARTQVGDGVASAPIYVQTRNDCTYSAVVLLVQFIDNTGTVKRDDFARMGDVGPTAKGVRCRLYNVRYTADTELPSQLGQLHPGEQSPRFTLLLLLHILLNGKQSVFCSRPITDCLPFSSICRTALNH